MKKVNIVLFQHNLKNYAKLVDANDDGFISAEEAENAIQVLDKLKKQQKRQAFIRYHRK